MVGIRDLVIGGGDFAVESNTPDVSGADYLALAGQSGSLALNNKMERDADAYNIKAETDLQLFGVQALNDTIMNTEDPEEITKKFFESYEFKYNELSRAAPNPLAKEKLSERYQGLRASFGQRAIGAQVEQVQNYRLAGMQESIDSVANAMVKGQIDYRSAKGLTGNIVAGGEKFLGPTQRYQMKKNTSAELAKLAWESTPDKVKIQALSGASKIKGGFNNAIELVHTTEGSLAQPLNPSDGASGAPAFMGINKRWHEDAYNEVTRIYQSKGIDAAKRYSDNFYKEQFWDKYDIGSLPEETQSIVMDGAVNHWEGFKLELINAAKSGATPEELIEMRRDEYTRLANSPGENNDYPWRESYEGWMNRLDTVSAGIFSGTGTAFDDLEVGDKVRAVEQLRKVQEDDAKLMQTDYQAYAAKYNINPIDAMQQQAQMNPYRLPSIISKPQAEQVAKELSTIQDYKQVIQMADQVPTEFEENYYNDLLQAKAPTSVIMAMQSVRKSPAYVKHAEYATLYTRLDPDNADIKKEDILKARGFAPKEIGSTVMEKFKSERLDGLIRNELKDGFAQSFIDNNANGTYGIAAGYLLANPKSSIDEAVEFAMQPLFHDFVLSRVNGYDIRVPKEAKEAPISAKLEGYIRDKAYQVPKDIDGADVDWEEMYPIYNSKTSSYDIVTGSSGLVYGKDGKPFTIGVTDLMAYETAQERLAKLPYAEREVERAKTFEFESKRQKRNNQKLDDKLSKPAGKSKPAGEL